MKTSLATQQEQEQVQNLPPATPRYILRGHASPVQALYFFASNTRLVSADADGWVILWDTVTKRPRAVWKAHGGSVLEVKAYERLNREMVVYTHGRDHKLRVWRIKFPDEEELLSRVLPVERSKEIPSSQQEQSAVEPWLLHSLPVNALNFCAFTICFLPSALEKRSKSHETDYNSNSRNNNNDFQKDGLQSFNEESPSYFAVPNALNSGAIDIFHLPSERRVSTIPADTSVQTGMVMAVKILTDNTLPGLLYMLSGYEDGHVMVHTSRTSSKPSESWKWLKLYASRPHSQPVLSLDSVKSEGDNRLPRFFFTSSADSLIVKHPIPSISPTMLQTASTSSSVEGTPLKILNTKHAGQQGLRARGDQKIFATAGWDARIRVYSCKTMKELAVLKWHVEGCYTVAFAETLPSTSESTEHETPENTLSNDQRAIGLVEQSDSPLQAVRRQRNQKVQQTHWLAAGSKDGKISLWDIY